MIQTSRILIESADVVYSKLTQAQRAGMLHYGMSWESSAATSLFIYIFYTIEPDILFAGKIVWFDFLVWKCNYLMTFWKVKRQHSETWHDKVDLYATGSKWLRNQGQELYQTQMKLPYLQTYFFHLFKKNKIIRHKICFCFSIQMNHVL